VQDAQTVADAIIELMKSLPVRTRAITAFNGTIVQTLCWKEFGDHECIAKDLNANVYFAHPYSSWERTSYENMNGLIGQCFPKKCNFAPITDTEIEFVMERLNNRPRKCLGFKSSTQVLFNHSPVVALSS
jgi:IS30 family transposase